MTVLVAKEPLRVVFRSYSYRGVDVAIRSRRLSDGAWFTLYYWLGHRPDDRAAKED